MEKQIIISYNKRHNFTSVSENIYIKKIQKKLKAKVKMILKISTGERILWHAAVPSEGVSKRLAEYLLSVLYVRHITLAAACYNQHK